MKPVNEQIRWRVWWQVRMQVDRQVEYGQVFDQVRDQVRWRVWWQVRRQVFWPFESKIKEQKDYFFT